MSHVDDGQLNALLDGELDREEKSSVEQHLAACRICRDRLEEARAFLIESGSLLEKLDARGVQSAQGAQGAQRPGRTAREKAIDLALPPSKTLREPAINIDGLTAKAAPSPFFPQAAERIAAEAGREIQAAEQAVKEEARAKRRARWGDVSQLAWAASIVLAIGVGFLTNEVMNLREQQARLQSTDLGAARVSDPAQAATDSLGSLALQDRDANPAAGAPAVAGRTGTGTTRTPGTPRPRLVKPPEQRGAQKPPDVTGEVNIPREARGNLRGRADEMAGAPSAAAEDPRSRVAGPPAAPGPVVTAAQPAAAPAPLAGAAAPPASLDAATQQRPPAAQRRLEAPAAPVRATFRRITADSAIRSLSGSIRLVDGMRPGVIELGRGYLVPGANPDRDVVRIHYQDSVGRSLILDQQPGDGGVGAPASVNGLMRGDTLITSSPSGGLRVRWVDRKNFWLSLTGPLTPEEIRALVERIR